MELQKHGFSFIGISEEVNKDGMHLFVYLKNNEELNENLKYMLYTEDEKLVGVIVVKLYEDAAEMMYSAVRDEAKNKGNVSIGVNEVLRHVFTNSNIDLVFLDIDEFNKASLRVAEKCGFVKTDNKTYTISKDEVLNKRSR